MTSYLKRWKIHENWGNPFFCPMYKKMISPHVEWCNGKCQGLCIISLNTSKWKLKFMLDPTTHLDIFMVLLVYGVEVVADICCDGGTTWNAIDGTVTVGMHQETFLTLVIGRFNSDLVITLALLHYLTYLTIQCNTLFKHVKSRSAFKKSLITLLFLALHISCLG